jgi:hypothetical protein
MTAYGQSLPKYGHYSIRPVPVMIEKTEVEDNNKKLNR